MLPIHPDLIKQMPPSCLEQLGNIPTEVSSLGVIDVAYLDALQAVYELAANDQPIPKELIGKVVLHTHAVIRENLGFRGLVDTLRGEIISTALKSGMINFGRM